MRTSFSHEQRQALQQFRSLLIEAGMHVWLAPYGSHEDRTDTRGQNLLAFSEPLQSIARLFCAGETIDAEAQLPREVIATLEELGFIERTGSMVNARDFRLVCHFGLFLFVQKLSPHTKLYYGNDSLALSHALLPAEGRVLDLCAGAGTQALVCARTATSVTAVDMEPLAEKVFWINAELNRLAEKSEFLIGDLLEPVAGRQFDLISCNPPFMPVPPGVRYPLYADGGPDGLVVVRRLLEGLPQALAPGGRCHAVGVVLGNAEGPDLSSMEKSAHDAGLKITVNCPSSEELTEDGPTLASLVATSPELRGDTKQVFQDHFASLGATHLYYYFLKATHKLEA